MTKYKNRRVLLPALILSFGALAGLTVPAAPQGICIPEPLSVTTVSGKVVARLEKGETPLTQASASLFKDQYKEHLVRQTMADANGYFSFGYIKAGKYVLVVSVPNLKPFSVRVRVKAFKAQSLPQEIVITIGADFTKPCSGSFAELRVKKDDYPLSLSSRP